MTRTRFSIGGVIQPQEGETFDDLARNHSKRTISRPPFRQEFLGGKGTTPLRYIITMADPPRTGYNSTIAISFHLW